MKRTKNNKVLLFILTGIAGFFISSCSSTKYIEDGEALYTKGIVEIQGDEVSKAKKKELEESLVSLLRPEPNASVFECDLNCFFTIWEVILQKQIK